MRRSCSALRCILTLLFIRNECKGRKNFHIWKIYIVRYNHQLTKSTPHLRSAAETLAPTTSYPTQPDSQVFRSPISRKRLFMLCCADADSTQTIAKQIVVNLRITLHFMQIYTFLSDSRPHNKIYILWQRPYTIIIYIIENYIFVIKQPFHSYISTILQ